MNQHRKGEKQKKKVRSWRGEKSPQKENSSIESNNAPSGKKPLQKHNER
jgi:hypothetical protein